jgi:uncharacterized protein with von Willebrand factor type A (vWA) domain
MDPVMADTTPLDLTTKLRVKDAMLVRARAELGAQVESASTERDAGQLDQDTSLEVDDISQADEAGDLERLLTDSASRQKRVVEQIEDLDFAHTDRVAAGAIVGFGGDRYVVGVGVGPFQSDGVTYEGIALDSPVYAEIEGLRVGDRFAFAGLEQRIDIVA